MSTYAYRRCSRSEIINTLHITDTDLRNPTADFVSELYTSLLNHLDVLNEEEKGHVDFEALGQFENPDHHVTSTQTMDLYIKVKDLLDMLDCPLQINFKDFIRPESSRTEIFIGVLLKYGLHRDEKMDVISPKLESLTLLDEERKQSEAKVSQLNAEIAEFEEACERESPFVQELEANIKELNQKIVGLHNQKMSLEATFRNISDKIKLMDNEDSKAEFDLVQTVQENANLRSLIGQSPDKLQGTLEEKKLVLGETKKTQQSAIETFQEQASILEVYEMAFKKFSKSSSKLQLINQEVTNAKVVEKECKALKAKLNDNALAYKSLEAKVVERERIVEQLHQSLKQLETEKGVLFDDWTKQLNEIKLQVESYRHELEARQTHVESVVAKVGENTAKSSQVRQLGETKVKRIAAKYEQIVNQFHQYTVSFDEFLPKPLKENADSIKISESRDCN